MLRELMHMGQIIQSHAMHFFELAGPDLLLGFDADPAVRNVVGVYQSDPKLAAAGIKLRQFGQQIIAVLGERRVHPNFAVPGGVRSPLNVQARDKIRADLPEMIRLMQTGIAVCKQWMDQHAGEVLRFGSFPTAYLGMVDGNDALQLYDGNLRLVDAQRRPMLKFSGDKYLDHICERVESWSYLKFPYYKALGWPSGAYRVGPLARLNSSTHIASPLAQAEYVKFHALGGSKVLEGTLCYHLARLIEGLYALERAGQILDDPEILSTDVQITGHVKNQQGVGVLEAPRGTLIHHYWVNENGQIEKVNLIVATGHNNYAMTRAVDEVAKMYIDPNNVTEGALNRIEAAIRAYDPCLSCSTHAVGSMPMVVSVYDAAGREVRTWERDER
jgi:NAD-reducing hydrogenase large subunit